MEEKNEWQEQKNELLADAAEKASSVAMWLGVRKYPSQQLQDAWVRTLWQQHHDGITGTSILSMSDTYWRNSLSVDIRSETVLHA